MAPRMDLIGLVVNDMARSLAFYRLLGVEVPLTADTEPHVEVLLPGGVRLAWDTVRTVRSFDPQWRAPRGGTRASLAFACDDAGEVDQVYETMVTAGYHGHLRPFDAPWGQRYAVLYDPDGNGVDLFAPLSRSAPS